MNETRERLSFIFILWQYIETDPVSISQQYLAEMQFIAPFVLQGLMSNGYFNREKVTISLQLQVHFRQFVCCVFMSNQKNVFHQRYL